MTYILIVYNNPENTEIIALYKFTQIKDIREWSKNMLNYSDSLDKVRKYVTHKSFFKIRKMRKKIILNLYE